MVAAGYDHTVGLKTDGTVVAAGIEVACQMESDRGSAVVTNTTLTEKTTIARLLTLVSVAVAVWAKRWRGKGPEFT